MNNDNNKVDGLAGIFFTVLFVIGLMYLGYKGYQNSKENEVLNVEISKHNQKQKEFLDSVLNDKTKADVEKWIDSNIEDRNKKVYKEFYADFRDLLLKGIFNKDTFFEIDQRLANRLHCIQGESDLNKFEFFSNKVIFESDKEKQMLTLLKRKYNYADHKIKIPDEEDLLEICDFKNFENDLKAVKDSPEADGSKIVTEQESEEE
jgi:hypothetical protein